MRFLPPATRALDVLQPVTVFRPVGRRPSSVYVDADMAATASAKAPHRLSDIVYLRAKAKPGDQIQERPGGMLLVTAAGESLRIAIAEPRPLEVEGAFGHAEAGIKADRAELDRLVAEGFLAEAPSAHQPKGPPAPAPSRMFEAGSALVLDKAPPKSAADDAPAAPAGRRRRF